MNVKRLRIFHEVFVTGSITRAAERSFVSQPAASKMLTSFEAEIGYKLFVRSNGKLIPTDEAHFLHDEVYSLLQSLNHLEDSLKTARNNKAGRLRICSIFGPTYRFLPQLIARYVDKYPGVQISMHHSGCSVIRQGVSSGQYQIGLVDKAQSSFSHESVAFNLPCKIALHQDHPAAKLDVVTPEDIGNSPWVTLDSENVTTKTLKMAYENRNLTLNRIIEVHSTVHALSFVELGVGVTLVDALNCQHFNDVFNMKNVRLRPFRPRVLEPLEVITSNVRPLSGVAREFHEGLVEELRSCIRTAERQEK
ncbi:LysR family transcriptional regulator [Thalassospira profundimaris]|uniref:LysR family transcriptional regulator n=1 Tax=Thalassospira profundimaris TaxID=502049 RepID=A0A367XBC1_9PROT|nr:LysR family transcriptional regulator [Thalassospira profundimaris]RCK50749.1 LysR family transcriptional regulator [Thalassospira profundimaris]